MTRSLLLVALFATSTDSFAISSITRRQTQTALPASISENDATMSTAMCVIPPDDAWDTIQRARHLAKDSSYHQWPPAIRLFHPFCPRSELSNVALNIAEIVQDYDIQPFEVGLNAWTIVPHMEALEADWEAMQQLPAQEENHQVEKDTEESHVEELIAREEQIGRDRLVRRQAMHRNQQHNSKPTKGSANDKHEEEESPRELLEKQKRMYEEFNGPCVVCLEPDEESRERLTQLRELLRDKLFGAYDKFSPSSSVSKTESLPRAVAEMDEVSFRPIVPIASFPTVTSAVEMARKLKGLWDPLHFNVTDFHLISYNSDTVSSEQQHDEFLDNAEYNLRKRMTKESEEETLTVQGQFGCDALVMLMGQEVDVDHQGSKEMVDLIMRQGSPGGYALLEHEGDGPSLTSSLNSAKAGKDDDVAALEDWLDDDDGWDEGNVVVIGRSHFFSGEMRTYTGMPAASAVDATDRFLGGGVASASARRKASRHRGSRGWKDGEFGRRESDWARKE